MANTNELIDSIINKQLGEYKAKSAAALNVGPTSNPVQLDWSASNANQMMSQGIGNLLGVINSPERRAEAAALSAKEAEQTEYDRGQNAFQNALAARSVRNQTQELDTIAEDKARKALLNKNTANYALKLKGEADAVAKDINATSKWFVDNMKQDGSGLFINEGGILVPTANATKEDIQRLVGFKSMQERFKQLSAQADTAYLESRADDDASNDLAEGYKTTISSMLDNAKAGVPWDANHMSAMTQGTQQGMASLDSKIAEITSADTSGYVGELYAAELDPNKAPIDIMSAGIDSLLGDSGDKKAIIGEINGNRAGWIKSAGDSLKGLSAKEREFVLAKAVQQSINNVGWYVPGQFGDFDDGDVVQRIKAVAPQVKAARAGVAKIKGYEADKAKLKLTYDLINKIGTGQSFGVSGVAAIKKAAKEATKVLEDGTETPPPPKPTPTPKPKPKPTPKPTSTSQNAASPFEPGSYEESLFRRGQEANPGGFEKTHQQGQEAKAEADKATEALRAKAMKQFAATEQAQYDKWVKGGKKGPMDRAHFGWTTKYRDYMKWAEKTGQPVPPFMRELLKGR